MSGRTGWLCACVGLIGLGGCFSETLPRSGVAPTDNSWQRSVSAVEGAVRRTLESITPEQHKPAVPWDWAMAIPLNVARAELLRPTIGESTLAALTPDFPRQTIVPVAGGRSSEVLLAAIDGQPIANHSQLHVLVEKVLEKGKPARVTLQRSDCDGTQAPTSAVNLEARTVEVTPAKLLALAHAAAAGQKPYRVAEGGNPWVVIRQDGVRCKVLARLERSRGLLHVALSLGVCWGQPALLPVDVCASDETGPLRCLSVAEILDCLYDEGPGRQSPAEPSSTSFAKVSERDDYLIPTNYKRLEAQAQTLEKHSAGPTRQPALLALQGIAYPGPAVLGDVRVLCGSLLQRQHLQPGEPERVGWIVFAGPALRRARNLELRVDLGNGPVAVNFKFPER